MTAQAIKGVLIANTVGLILAIIAIVVLVVMFLSAKKELFDYKTRAASKISDLKYSNSLNKDEVKKTKNEAFEKAANLKPNDYRNAEEKILNKKEKRA